MEDNQQQVVPPQQAPPVVEPNVSPSDVLTPQEPPKKGNKAIWFLGLLTVLVLLAVAYLAYQNNQLKKELKVVKLSNATTKTQALISPTEAITPTPDPIANWEVYTSKLYNYRFRHPDLIINPCSTGGLTNDDLLDVVVGKGSQSTMHSCGDDYSVAVFVDKNANLNSVDVKTSFYKDYVLKTYGEEFEIIQSPSKVGNYEATKLVIRPDQYSLLFAQNPTSPLFTITVRSTTDQKEIDQILSTFEFTE